MENADSWLTQAADSLGVSVNEVFEIEHAGRGKLAWVGENAVVKLYPTGSRKLASAIEANDLLLGKNIAPRILKQANIDSANTILLFERVEGSALAYSSMYDPGYRNSIVETLARLHSVRGDGFSRRIGGAGAPVPSWGTFLSAHFEGCEERYLSLTEKTAPRWFMQQTERALSLVEAASDVLSEIEPSLVHRDVTCENGIVADNGQCKLIDFDLAAFYDPLIDLVKLQLFAPPSAADSLKGLIHNYRSRHGMDAESFETRLRLVRALELLWGFPALLQMSSPAALIWKEEIRAEI